MYPDVPSGWRSVWHVGEARIDVGEAYGPGEHTDAAREEACGFPRPVELAAAGTGPAPTWTKDPLPARVPCESRHDQDPCCYCLRGAVAAIGACECTIAMVKTAVCSTSSFRRERLNGGATRLRILDPLGIASTNNFSTPAI